MSWKVKISNLAQQDLDQLRAYNHDLYVEAYEISKSIEKDPYLGRGLPRKADVLGANVWYRNISLEHRIVYEVFDDATVLIAAFRTHID